MKQLNGFSLVVLVKRRLSAALQQLEMILWTGVVSWVKFQFEIIGAVGIMSSWPSIDILTVQIYGTVWYRTVWYRLPIWIRIAVGILPVNWFIDGRHFWYQTVWYRLPLISKRSVFVSKPVPDFEGMIERNHNNNTYQTMLMLTMSSGVELNVAIEQLLSVLTMMLKCGRDQRSNVRLELFYSLIPRQRWCLLVYWAQSLTSLLRPNYISLMQTNLALWIGAIYMSDTYHVGFEPLSFEVPYPCYALCKSGRHFEMFL